MNPYLNFVNLVKAIVASDKYPKISHLSRLVLDEIALNEFGKYLENPSSYSVENKYDYVNKKIDDILSNKSISNKYKYFIDNYSSYKNLMDSVDWNNLIAKLNNGIARAALFNLNIK